ncbi:MAG: helix-turn-helix domain-containing protein [Spirochaetes bacterium]|nr:helix-turn-helix domain-containing protein [Spirochaetota bacterium]
MRLRGIGFHETRGPVPAHRDAGIEFHYLLEGEGFFAVEGRRTRVVPGDFFYALPEEAHQIVPIGDPGWVRQYVLQADFDGTEGEVEALLRGPMRAKRYFRVGARRRWFFEGLRRRHQSGNPHLVASVPHELAAFLFQCMGESAHPDHERQDGLVESALAHFQRSLGERVDLGALCRRLGVNREHFIRLFKRRVGHPPLRYFTMLKVGAAADLLASTKLPLDQIADRLAFTDASHLRHRVTIT